MASRTQEEILEHFRMASGGGDLTGTAGTDVVVMANASLPDALQEATKAVQGLTGATRVQEGAIAAATRVLTPASEEAQAVGNSTASKVASAVLKSGLGFAPLVQGIVRLFGGGSEPEVPVLPRYERPAAIRFEKALSDGVITDADYDQTGSIRTVAPRLASPQPAGPSVAVEADARAGYGEAPRAVVNVNVQAMDSQSFLDHSQDIARAVRDAMLNLNSINDVVNDL